VRPGKKEAYKILKLLLTYIYIYSAKL